MAADYRSNSQVAALVTDTAGRDVTAVLTVRAADQLGCGCTRLTCDRPGPIPAARGVHLLTGCARGHEQELA